MERQLFYFLLLLSIPLTFRFHPRTPTLITLCILLLGGAVAAFLRSARETRRMNPLADADRLFRANSLLTTAWDVRESDERRYSELSRQIVLNRAAPLLGRIRTERIYPYEPSRHLRLMPLALLFLGGVWLATIAFDTSGPAWSGYSDDDLSRYRNPAPENLPEEDRSGAALADELTQLSEALERRPSEKDLMRDQGLVLPDDSIRNRRLGATDLLNQDSGRPLAEGNTAPDASLRETREDETQPLSGLDSGGVPTDPPTGDGEDMGTPRSDGTDQTPGEETTSRDGPSDDGAPGGGTERTSPDEDATDENGTRRSSDTEESEKAATNGEAGEESDQESDSENEPGLGEPGTDAMPDLPDTGPPRPRTMNDAIRQVLELPRIDADGEVTELLALETAGESNGADPQSGTLNPEFERRLQMTLNRSAIPRELQEYVRNYFIIIARRQEEEE